jgi:hypothetical protein
MWKTARQFFKQINSDRGFTLIEAITLIGVLSILGVVLWSGAALAMRATTDMNSRLDISSTVLKVEHTLREKGANVRFPFWLNACLLELDGNMLTIFYYHGVEHNTLKLRFEDEQLWIIENVNETEQGLPEQEAPEQKQSFGPFEKVEFSAAHNQNRGIYGININIWPKQEEEQAGEEDMFTIMTEFGSTPLRSMETDE